MLVKVGANELKLGQTERDFINHAVTSWVTPLSNFLENEVKNYTKERKVLENRRYRLDFIQIKRHNKLLTNNIANAIKYCKTIDWI